MTPEFESTMQGLYGGFYVPDILLPTSSCIFVLESPHVEELKYGAPVSGNSGRTMSKHIFGPDYARFPLGQLVKKNADERLDRPRLNGIGLLNVSNIPLQKAAYGKTDFPEDTNLWLEAMGTLRTSNQKSTFSSSHTESVQSYFIENLKTKLHALQDRPITLIPCGRFAQKFVRLADVRNQSWRVIDDVPHPSYNSWDREQYRLQVHSVIRAVTEAARHLDV